MPHILIELSREGPSFYRHCFFLILLEYTIILFAFAIVTDKLYKIMKLSCFALLYRTCIFYLSLWENILMTAVVIIT